jgi:hypothetical protein
VNRPGKVIRWSVAIEPVTATGTGGLLGGGTAATAWSRLGIRPGSGSGHRTL